MDIIKELINHIPDDDNGDYVKHLEGIIQKTYDMVDKEPTSTRKEMPGGHLTKRINSDNFKTSIKQKIINIIQDKNE